jgi:HSP20 family protein
MTRTKPKGKKHETKASVPAVTAASSASAPGPDGFGWLHRPSWLEDFAVPAMRIEQDEQDSQVRVRAEIPGIDPEKDLEINVADGVLRIRAERREDTTEERDGYRRSEFHYGAVARSVTLPAGAVSGDVTASYHDGIVEVVVPVDAKRAEATRVPVSRR